MSGQHKKFQLAVREATAAGNAAVEAAHVAPMVVGTPRDMGASLMGDDSGGFDPNEPVYYVADGPCGFAWVNVKAKATEGRQFMNWLKGSVKSTAPASEVLNGLGVHSPSYYGGLDLWVRGFGQSMQKKEAFAQAFSDSLNAAGFDGLVTYSMSRMD
jgi:hypothetical protein